MFLFQYLLYLSAVNFLPQQFLLLLIHLPLLTLLPDSEHFEYLPMSESFVPTSDIYAHKDCPLRRQPAVFPDVLSQTAPELYLLPEQDVFLLFVLPLQPPWGSVRSPAGALKSAPQADDTFLPRWKNAFPFYSDER